MNFFCLFHGTTSTSAHVREPVVSLDTDTSSHDGNLTWSEVEVEDFVTLAPMEPEIETPWVPPIPLTRRQASLSRFFNLQLSPLIRNFLFKRTAFNSPIFTKKHVHYMFTRNSCYKKPIFTVLMSSLRIILYVFHSKYFSVSPSLKYLT